MSRQSGFTLTELLGLLGGLAFIFSLCAVAYGIVHFVAKYW